MPARLLAVHAHPDDESLSMAGTLATAALGGAEVVLVTATLGEEGDPGGLGRVAGHGHAGGDRLVVRMGVDEEQPPSGHAVSTGTTSRASAKWHALGWP